jgi:RNA polymerase sigma-70 factor (ECF subfamily)
MRTNEQWLSELREPGPLQEVALTELRTIIHANLPYALNKWLSPDNPQFDALIEETTQETLLRVLDRFDTFEGRSKFTTWVYKIAIRIALTKMRRRKWRDVSLDNLFEDRTRPSTLQLMTDNKANPEADTEQKDMLALIQKLIEDELTIKQRHAMTAIAIHGMPIEEVARRMNTNRNVLYKLLHDARLRLKRSLVQEGLTPGSIIAIFEQGQE